jgi:hypothetical protein
MSAAQQLVGVWRLVSFEGQGTDGVVSYLLCNRLRHAR